MNVDVEAWLTVRTWFQARMLGSIRVLAEYLGAFIPQCVARSFLGRRRGALVSGCGV